MESAICEQRTGIGFSDLKEELKISHFNLLKLRKEKLKPEDWYMVEGKSFFTEEAADKLRLAVEVPLAVPKRVRGKVVRAAPNPRWVYAQLEGKGPLVPVAIPRRLYDRLIGKLIYVDVIKDAQGGTSYRHEALGG